MFLHHWVAIGLLTFSYSVNMVRVGSLVICLHDAADFWLEVSISALFCLLLVLVLNSFHYQSHLYPVIFLKYISICNFHKSEDKCH